MVEACDLLDPEAAPCGRVLRDPGPKTDGKESRLAHRSVASPIRVIDRYQAVGDGDPVQSLLFGKENFRTERCSRAAKMRSRPGQVEGAASPSLFGAPRPTLAVWDRRAATVIGRSIRYSHIDRAGQVTPNASIGQAASQAVPRGSATRPGGRSSEPRRAGRGVRPRGVASNGAPCQQRDSGQPAAWPELLPFDPTIGGQRGPSRVRRVGSRPGPYDRLTAHVLSQQRETPGKTFRVRLYSKLSHVLTRLRVRESFLRSSQSGFGTGSRCARDCLYRRLPEGNPRALRRPFDPFPTRSSRSQSCDGSGTIEIMTFPIRRGAGRRVTRRSTGDLPRRQLEKFTLASGLLE